jgi:hypothetical protein
MTPATIIREAQSDGVSLTLSPAGTIKATGDGAAANRWLPLIREHKAEIIGLLTAQQEPPGAPPAAEPAPFDSEAWEERVAICEFDGGLSRDEAEAIAWHEDDRRRCAHCLNLRGKVCGIAEPGGLVSARRGYTPVDDLPRRCEGYRPCPDDPDRRPGTERWPGLNDWIKSMEDVK